MTDHPHAHEKAQQADRTEQVDDAHVQRKLPENAVQDLESPEPGTHTIDKVITPVSNKKLENQTQELNRKLDEVEAQRNKK
ncbi:hypothetical protein IQ22_01479 [Pseudomonas duriflava]|uniref:Uncharacterized protein n=1 Tax=Pseudomonas duriflava TaxID=459528 RepID=A0A562QFT3_9PSED|nr:hypothetical protein [Pseudomonas duriflava]TWI55553.1 hypothetical protein IQ22_01479 [Pseudomonas duriflava]